MLLTAAPLTGVPLTGSVAAAVTPFTGCLELQDGTGHLLLQDGSGCLRGQAAFIAAAGGTPVLRSGILRSPIVIGGGICA